MLNRVVRTIAAGLIALVAGWMFLHSVELFGRSVEHQIEVEERESERESSEPGDDLEAAKKPPAPHPARSIRTQLWLNPVGKSEFILHVAHTIQVMANDPLVDQVRSGNAAQSDAWIAQVSVDVKVQPRLVRYWLPTIETGRSNAKAVIRISGYLHPPAVAGLESGRMEPVMIRLAPALDPPAQQTISMTGNRWTLAGIRGQVPESQNERSFDFRSVLRQRSVVIWVPDRPTYLLDDLQTTLDPENSEIEEDPTGASWTAMTWVLWLCIVAPPWITLLLNLGRSASAVRIPLRAVAWTGLLTLPLLVVTEAGEAGSTATSFWLLTLTPLLSLLVWRRMNGAPCWRPRDTMISAGATFLALAIGLPLLTIGWERQPPTLVILLWLMAAAAGVGCAYRVFGAATRPTVAAAAAVFVGGLFIGLIGLSSDLQISSAAPLLVATGLLWVAALAVPLRELGDISPRRWLATVAIVGVLAMLPVSSLTGIEDPAVLWTSAFVFTPGDSAVTGPFAGTALLLTLLAASVLTLRRFGTTGAALSEPLVRGMAFVLVAGLLTLLPTLGQASWWNVWQVLAALWVLGWLMPRVAADRAGRLAQVSPQVHARLVRNTLRQRLLRASADDLYRSARAGLAAGELEVTELDRRNRTLETGQGQVRPHRPEWIAARDAAFGSGFGHSPWHNGLLASGLGLLLALPYLLYEGITLLELIDKDTLTDDRTTMLETVATVGYLFRWGIYGLIFGYFYPLLRGRTPTMKAVALWAALMPIEFIPLYDSTWGTDTNLLQAMAIRGGQILVFAIGLGLIWEARAMHAADLPWSRVRNIRNLRTLGPPVLAVVIAAATAAATVLASNTVSGILQPPNPQPSQSSTPTPTRTP